MTNGSFLDEWLILDIHTTDEIAGDNVDGWGFRVGGMSAMITNATDEAAAFYYDVDMGWHEEFYASTEGVDVDFLVLGDDCLAQIHADAAAESVDACTVEVFAAIDILITAVVYRATDALAFLANGQRALEPLVWVAPIAVDD